jgi:hypothetical protein
MEQLKKEFLDRPRDEKLVMGYLASDNSAYDLLALIVDLMQNSNKDGWNEYVDEISTDRGTEDWYIK